MSTVVREPQIKQKDSEQRPAEKQELAPPATATALERLLWTPTSGEDATKALFPLSSAKKN